MARSLLFSSHAGSPRKKRRCEEREGGRKKMSIDNLTTYTAPLHTMRHAAGLVGVTVQSMRIYERHGFVQSVPGGRGRLYSDSDVRLLRCIRDLVHVRKISIAALKKLLGYAPCWEIRACGQDCPRRTSAADAHPAATGPGRERSVRHCEAGVQAG